MAEPIIEVGGSDTLWAEPIIEVCVTDIVLKALGLLNIDFLCL